MNSNSLITKKVLNMQRLDNWNKARPHWILEYPLALIRYYQGNALSIDNRLEKRQKHKQWFARPIKQNSFYRHHHHHYHRTKWGGQLFAPNDALPTANWVEHILLLDEAQPTIVKFVRSSFAVHCSVCFLFIRLPTAVPLSLTYHTLVSHLVSGKHGFVATT